MQSSPPVPGSASKRDVDVAAVRSMSLSRSQKMAIIMTEEEIEGATFDAFVKATGHKKPFKLDIDRALSLESMEGKKDDVLSCETQEDF